MPLIMGPLYDSDDLPGLNYPLIENIAIQFETEPEAARQIIPTCYTVDNKPIITVIFGYFNGLDFLAGNGYNIAAVQVSAKFDGERDHVSGDYIPIMFENQTMPILGGREFLGVPKLYANIPPAKVLPDGTIRCEASLWGHLLFGLEIPPLKKQNRVVRSVASSRINSRPWLGYKHLPALDGPPDADYPTLTKNEVKIETLWMGKIARLYFGTASEGDIAHTAHVIDALRPLTLKKIEQVLHFQGSAVLRLDETRRLK